MLFSGPVMIRAGSGTSRLSMRTDSLFEVEEGKETSDAADEGIGMLTVKFLVTTASSEASLAATQLYLPEELKRNSGVATNTHLLICPFL